MVIGSGMGGLTAAILLQSHGWDVTVLERHHRAGGFLHRFFRAGVGYDTGFHYVGAADPEGLLGRVLRHLGVEVPLVPLDPDGFDILSFPGLTLRVPAGMDRWAARLGEAFPHARDDLRRYFGQVREATAAYGWLNLDPSVPPDAVLPWESRSVAEVLSATVADPRLRSVLVAQSAPLYGVGPSEAPFGLHAVVTSHFLSGAWSIAGGGDRLALQLCRRLRALGGRLVLKQPATAIRMEGGAAIGVEGRDGAWFPADLVVTDIHPARVLDLMPEGTLRPAYVSRVRDAAVGPGHLGLYLQVSGDTSRLARRNLYRYDTWDLEEALGPTTPERVPFCFLAASGLRDGTFREEDRDVEDAPGAAAGEPEATSPLQEGAGRAASRQARTVVGLMLADREAFRPWLREARPEGPIPADSRRPEGYLRYKAALTERAVATVEAEQGWTVLQAELSTPLSTLRYTDSPEGAMYGHHHTVAQMGRYRFPHRLRARGVLQAGQSVGFPGLCGAAISAYVACAEVLGTETLMAELSGGETPPGAA